MDSQEQVTEQSTNEQSEGVNSDEVDTPQSQTFEVWWETLTWEQLIQNYTKLQWEYAQSREELSALQQNTDIPDEQKQTIEVLEKLWFVRKNDLDAFEKKQKDQANLSELMTQNPSLKQFEWAIKSLWEKDWLAYEDVIEKYGFASKDKLAKARIQWGIVWNANLPWQEKSTSEMIRDMTPKEFEAWKIKNASSGLWSFS